MNRLLKGLMGAALVTALVQGGAAVPAMAGTAGGSPPAVERLITDAFVSEIRIWAFAPVIRAALQGRSEVAGDLSDAEIDALDKQWRAEREADLQPLITSVLTGPVSSYLTRIQARSVGLFTEIFVMDRNGLNVGQSAITTDYWQGDEAKFQKTFDVSADAVFVDEPEFDEKLGIWRAQVNLTVADEAGRAAGAVTVEVNLTELERRRALLTGP